MNRGAARRMMRTAGLLLALAGLAAPGQARARVEPPAGAAASTASTPEVPPGSADTPSGPSLGAWSPGEARPAGEVRPAGEAPAPVIVAPERPPAPAQDRPPQPTADRRAARNPRASRKWSAAAAAFGPTHGLGVVAEYLPHWVAGFGFGVGGAMRQVADRALLGSGTLFVEIAILPVPFAVTPVIGAGFAVTMGPLAEFLPGFAGSPPRRDEFLKLVPYGRFGLRVDLRRNFYLAGEIMIAPDNRFLQGGGTHPLPSFRIGFNFL